MAKKAARRAKKKTLRKKAAAALRRGKKATRKVGRPAGKKASKKVAKKAGRKAAKKVAKKAGRKVAKKVSKKAGRKATKKVTKKAGRKAGKKAAKKIGRKATKKAGRQAAKKAAKKAGRKNAAKTPAKAVAKSAKKASRKVAAKAGKTTPRKAKAQAGAVQPGRRAGKASADAVVAAPKRRGRPPKQAGLEAAQQPHQDAVQGTLALDAATAASTPRKTRAARSDVKAQAKSQAAPRGRKPRGGEAGAQAVGPEQAERDANLMPRPDDVPAPLEVPELVVPSDEEVEGALSRWHAQAQDRFATRTPAALDAPPAAQPLDVEGEAEHASVAPLDDAIYVADDEDVPPAHLEDGEI